jgi:hypothetical protein
MCGRMIHIEAVLKSQTKKLTHLTSTLRQWSAICFGAVRRELRNLRKKLGILHANPQRTGPFKEEKKIEGKIVILNLK